MSIDSPSPDDQADGQDDAGTPPARRGTVTPFRRRGAAPTGTMPIAGMRPGWYYRAHDRMILHSSDPGSPPMPIGQVPRVTGLIVHYTDDGQFVRIEYQIRGYRQQRARIVTEDELDRGTWANKAGMQRPTGTEERMAFARVIRQQGMEAPQIPARAYYNEDGDLVLPDGDAQTLGYGTVHGTEEDARESWLEIGGWTACDGKASLVLGAMMVAPVLDHLEVLAHMLNLRGPGQQGKSTIITVAAALYGDIKPRRQQILTTWNSSKQGITQSLRMRGFMPMCLDEHSSSGRAIKDSSREISAMVSGAVRLMGTADGSPREIDGFFWSLLLSTSNESLKYSGQTEDLATRLQELPAPFFDNHMLTPEGDIAPPGHKAAEHLSKRLKRYAKNAGGWPVRWAQDKGMYEAENLEIIKALHLELCAKYRPYGGGIPGSIAEIYCAWVTGAYMLGHAIGVPEIGPAAEYQASVLLQEAYAHAAESNLTDGERLWAALDALRIDVSAFPDLQDVVAVAREGKVRLKGFMVPHTDRSGPREWWVIDPVVRQAAKDAELDNLTSALRDLANLGIHDRPGAGKHTQKKTPKPLQAAGLPLRMHVFLIDKAIQAYDGENAFHSGSRDGTTSGTTSGTTPSDPSTGPLTCDGTTGTTGTTFSRLELVCAREDKHLEAVRDDQAPEEAKPQVRAQIPAQEARTQDDAPTASTGAVVPADNALTCGGTTFSEGGTTGTGVSTSAPVPPRPAYPPRMPGVAYPDPLPIVGGGGFDGEWAALEFAARRNGNGGQAWMATRIGVLGNGLLYLPNHHPTPVEMPATLGAVPDLMRAYELRTLYMHKDAVVALGLPDHDPDKEGGPAAPQPSEWAVLGGRLIEASPTEGVSPWMTLKTTDGAALNLVIPEYETRLDKYAGGPRGGFAGPTDPAVLLDAVMVWVLSTRKKDRHGNVSVVPYYRNPNKTGEDFAGGKSRKADVYSEAIRTGQVPIKGVRTMVPQYWHRDPTADELGAAYVHKFDRSASWLAAYGAIKLGSGDPKHSPDPMPYDQKLTELGGRALSELAALLRVRDVPENAGIPGLPELVFTKAVDADGNWDPEDGYLILSPDVDLARELDPDWRPEVLEAWYWVDSRRVLEPMYERLRKSREYILAGIEAGRPGAKWAKAVNGKVYQSFRGYLVRNRANVLKDWTDPDGERLYEGDIFWNPVWGQLMVCLAMANTYRNLRDYHEATGRTPLSLHVDAVTYTHDDPDYRTAKPGPMILGPRGGQWTSEGVAPMPELLARLERAQEAHPDDTINFHHLVRAHLDELEDTPTSPEEG